VDLTAKVRLTVLVPFRFDVDKAPEIELEPLSDGTMGLANRERHEQAHLTIEQQKIEASKYAEQLARSLNVASGNIVDVLVEEVYDSSLNNGDEV
jgi:hypothetical protein